MKIPAEVYPLILPVAGVSTYNAWIGYRHLRKNPDVWIAGKQEPH
jgi:hypothetical protein